MGGMYTNVMVRPRPVDVDRDPGWYENPPGTQAQAVTPERAARDGVRLS